MFRGTLGVRKALNLIDHLPPTSHYIAALADDEDLAEEAADLDMAPKPPKLSEWSPEVSALAVIADRLAALINVQVARGGGKAAKVQPYPRPVTAVQRLAVNRRIRRHNALVAKLLPPEQRSSAD